MKRIILSLIFMISCFSLSSCIALEDLTYQDVYIEGTVSYPVYYINSYPYYYVNNTWIIVPRYRYSYIHHINYPKYIHAYRPRPQHYSHPHNDYYYYRRNNYDRRPNPGVPHTRQPGNINRQPSHNNGNIRPNNPPRGNRDNRGFGSRR